MLLLFASLSACSVTKDFSSLTNIFSGDDSEEPQDEFSAYTEEQFAEEAKIALDEERWTKAIQLYEKLEARYPFGPYTTQAQINIAYAYYKNNEPDSALAAVDRFIKLNPAHPNVDYAYYLKGLINYNRGLTFVDRFVPTDPSQRDPGAARLAFRDFEELVNKFPNSRYAEDSRKRITALRNNLAMYELHVAEYYMRRGAYLAASRRGAEILRNYQRTPAVPEALQIMEAAYRKLEMDDLADDISRVYAFNYANGVPTEAEGLEYEPALAERVMRTLGFE
ncbi:outer membrane protein assembly factor BamD [Methylolobus aquaticus]|uniref:outer membrane protein assembly factor BamD n=1 Tax=Methylotetracoccus oryzae TaxID=1919059 RepID=UPI001021E968|nr:outer membrane protein assembly factor BamD [Methylotetracoccus oryzae]RYU61974.1 outer membrane protein assembly factor BamD [Methylolobus aquaticus]